MNVFNYGQNITVYAKWNVRTYNVSFDLNGGDGTYESVSITMGKHIVYLCLKEMDLNFLGGIITM